MSDLIERLKDQCTCQTYEGPGEPECVECDSVREIERLNAQALDLACEISKARRERDEALKVQEAMRRELHIYGFSQRLVDMIQGRFNAAISTNSPEDSSELVPGEIICEHCGRSYDPLEFGRGGCPWIGCPSDQPTVTHD